MCSSRTRRRIQRDGTASQGDGGLLDEVSKEAGSGRCDGKAHDPACEPHIHGGSAFALIACSPTSSARTWKQFSPSANHAGHASVPLRSKRTSISCPAAHSASRSTLTPLDGGAPPGSSDSATRTYRRWPFPM